jgi:heme oxygenase
MSVDLTQVDPTELTEAQATQLVEAALVVFETATEGSPEYEQALDALYLAAEQDDIVVDEALANIPGVGQAAVAIANVLNAIGNVGADISPKARKKAQGLVVTTLIVGQIAQAAALASASSGGSLRRKQ